MSKQFSQRSIQLGADYVNQYPHPEMPLSDLSDFLCSCGYKRNGKVHNYKRSTAQTVKENLVSAGKLKEIPGKRGVYFVVGKLNGNGAGIAANDSASDNAGDQIGSRIADMRLIMSREQLIGAMTYNVLYGNEQDKPRWRRELAILKNDNTRG